MQKLSNDHTKMYKKACQAYLQVHLPERLLHTQRDIRQVENSGEKERRKELQGT